MNFLSIDVIHSGDLAASNDYFEHYYVDPWARAPVYLVGIWFGWYLHVTKESPIRLSKVYISRLLIIKKKQRIKKNNFFIFYKPVVALAWTLSTAAGLAIVYGMKPYVDESKVPEISLAVSMTYGPLHRTAWAIVIGWIIFACSRGYGGQ